MATFVTPSNSFFNIQPASCRTPADSQRIQAVVWSQAIGHLTFDLQVITAEAPLRAEPRQLPAFRCCQPSFAVTRFSDAFHLTP